MAEKSPTHDSSVDPDKEANEIETQQPQHTAKVLGKSKTTREPYYIEECPSMIIPGTSWSLQGMSYSACRTGFVIKNLQMYLDGGINAKTPLKYMLISHCHADHCSRVGEVAIDYARKMNYTERCTIFCPESMTRALDEYTRSAHSLSKNLGCTTQEKQLWIKGVCGGDSFPLQIPKKKGKFIEVQVDIVKCYHKVPSIGFILSEPKQKLKKEYIGMKGKEIKQLIDNKIDIYEHTMVKRFAFMGDTTINVFEDPRLLQVPYLMVECTFITDDTTVETAMKRGHIHWKQLEPIIKANPHVTFMLIHFSHAYKEDFLEDFFTKHGHPNMIIWLPNKVIRIVRN